MVGRRMMALAGAMAIVAAGCASAALSNTSVSGTSERWDGSGQDKSVIDGVCTT